MRPTGLSGWVTTATTSCLGVLMSQRREGRPMSPVPMKRTRMRGVEEGEGNMGGRGHNCGMEAKWWEWFCAGKFVCETGFEA